MEPYYEIEIAGLKRRLPVCAINEKEAIAAFVPFSDVELTQACIRELLRRLPAFDIVLTAESKGITFAYEMTVQSGIPYVLARKKEKLYMKEPVCMEVQSITTQGGQRLYIDKTDMEQLRDKRVLILDDVVSTGNSLFALEQLAQAAQGIITAKACILAEGAAKDLPGLTYLSWIPILKV